MSRVGVFACHCGVNISSTVDVEKITEELAHEDSVVFTADYKYMCSDPGQKLIKDAIKEHNLDSVVVASCSPSLHERTFQLCVEAGGLNRYKFEMVNIREQCSWVHKDKESATEKAKDLLKMAVAKVRKNEPLSRFSIPVLKKALVIGAGIAGIQTSLGIARAGHKVVLLERTPSIGGRMAQLDKTFPTLDCSACILTPRMVEAAQDENIEIHTYSEIVDVGGYVGNFDVKIRKRARFVDMEKCTGCGTCYQKCPVKVPGEFDMEMGMRKAIYVPFPQAVPNIPVIDKEHCRMFTKGKCQICQKLCQAEAVDYEQEDEIIEDKFGAIVVTTGYDLFDASVYGEYGGGRFKDVITSLQLERLICASGPTGGHITRPSDGKEPKNVVFVQCVGSRDIEKGLPYCSNVCCMYTAKHAVLLKEHMPDVQTNVFYMDIRSSGKNYEQFVQQTMEKYGALYIRGRVSKIYQRGDKLIVKGADTLAGCQVEVEADLVVLATAITSRHDSKELAQILGIPYDQFGFFSELHPKLAPVETVTSGMFLAGACQSPKDIPDTVASAGDAASKIAALFSSDHLLVEPLVSTIDTSVCSMCKACSEVCPYSAIQEEEITLRDGTKKKQLKVLESVCQGCGACVSTCRSSCIMLKGMTDEQIFEELMAVAQ